MFKTNWLLIQEDCKITWGMINMQKSVTDEDKC